MQDTVFDSTYLNSIPKVDIVVPSQAKANITDQNLDTFCDRIGFDSHKKIVQSFLKVQKLREDFLQRKLKELCDEHMILKAMNVTGAQNQENQIPTNGGFLQAERPKITTESISGLVPHKPRTSAKKTYVSYEDHHQSCKAEQDFPRPDCEAPPTQELVKLGERTTTVYADKTLVILPTDEYGTASGLFKADQKDIRDHFM